MILDTLTLMSDNQDLAQAAGPVFSDVLNQLGNPGYTTSQDAPLGIQQDLGKGTPVPFLCQVTEDFASGGAATLVVSLETSVDEAFTSPITLMTSGTFAIADLVAGTHLLPEHVPYGSLQYLRVKYQIAIADTTAGKVTCGITTGIQSNT